LTEGAQGFFHDTKGMSILKEDACTNKSINDRDRLDCTKSAWEGASGQINALEVTQERLEQDAA